MYTKVTYDTISIPKKPTPIRIFVLVKKLRRSVEMSSIEKVDPLVLLSNIDRPLCVCAITF